MTAPLRGTQSLVGQMGFVYDRPLLTLIEVAWRWLFGIPFLAVCSVELQKILVAVPPESAGLNAINAQNPWQASLQMAHAWSLYEPRVSGVLRWLAPLAALAWVVMSGIGRSFVLQRLDSGLASRLRFRLFAMMLLQAGWLALLGAICWAWFASMQWAAATHITTGAEPDLVGFAFWAIFLALGFFTLWALVSWTLSIAPLVMLLEDRSALSALGQSLRLGKPFTGKLVEINLVMGIVNLALIVLAMVLSAAPLPFSDQLGPDALHWISAAAVVFYLIATDYFQVVRLKGFEEFWKMFRGERTRTAK
jgi:hypothetical protein